MNIGLVLGAGGTVGVAYHAGVLRAIEQAAGFQPDHARVIVGTSAGALVGAYLRAGWSTEQMWQVAMGTHPSLAALTAEELAAARDGIFAPTFGSPIDLARRTVGSAYVVARALIRVPLGGAPIPLQRVFPAGMFLLAEGRRRMQAELAETWPDKPLWLCAVDISSGRRIVLGRETATDDAPLHLHEAVLASCAIPGLYQPVRVGRRTLIDGGTHSSTNLDLMAAAGCDLVVVVAPMAYDGRNRPNAVDQVVRQVWTRRLAHEKRVVRATGTRVFALCPSPSELRLHGYNYMRRSGWDAIALAAYDSTARAIEQGRVGRDLAA